jgi:hypothetical protein
MQSQAGGDEQRTGAVSYSGPVCELSCLGLFRFWIEVAGGRCETESGKPFIHAMYAAPWAYRLARAFQCHTAPVLRRLIRCTRSPSSIQSARGLRVVKKEPSPQEWNVYAGGWWLHAPPRIRPDHEWPLILRIQ